MYKHNDLLEQLVEVGKTNNKPWEEFEICFTFKNAEYYMPDSVFALISAAEQNRPWRRKPKTVNINGIECIDDWVKTESDLELRQEISVESPASEEWQETWGFMGDEDDAKAIERNIAHFTPEGAAQACKARYGIED